MLFSAVIHPKVSLVRVFQYKSKSGLNVRSFCRDESNTCYFCPAANVWSQYAMVSQRLCLTFVSAATYTWRFLAVFVYFLDYILLFYKMN